MERKQNWEVLYWNLHPSIGIVAYILEVCWTKKVLKLAGVLESEHY